MLERCDNMIFYYITAAQSGLASSEELSGCFYYYLLCHIST